MEDKSSNIKERILQVSEYKKVSKELFFQEIGMTYGNFKGKSKNTPINSNALVDLITRYPDISLDWLVTGQGEMLKSNEKTSNTSSAQHGNSEMIKNTPEQYLVPASGSIPFYEDIDVTAGPDILFTDGSTQPTDYIHVPSFQDCDLAFPIYGDSMWPVYQNGQVILCKEFYDWRYYIPFGEVFLIITDHLRTIKYVKKADNEQNLLLVSENKHFQPFELPKEHIRRMFFVKGAIKRNMI